MASPAIPVTYSVHPSATGGAEALGPRFALFRSIEAALLENASLYFRLHDCNRFYFETSDADL
jgi:hypothetical protein